MFGLIAVFVALVALLGFIVRGARPRRGASPLRARRWSFLSRYRPTGASGSLAAAIPIGWAWSQIAGAAGFGVGSSLIGAACVGALIAILGRGEFLLGSVAFVVEAFGLASSDAGSVLSAAVVVGVAVLAVGCAAFVWDSAPGASPVLLVAVVLDIVGVSLELGASPGGVGASFLVSTIPVVVVAVLLYAVAPVLVTALIGVAAVAANLAAASVVPALLPGAVVGVGCVLVALVVALVIAPFASRA